MNIDIFLESMMEHNASDLHICANSKPVIRKNGALIRLEFPELTSGDSQQLMYELLTPEQVTRFEKNHELDFAYAIPQRARFRVNMYRDRGAVSAAFRLIPNRIPELKELNLPPILEQIAERPRGLVLVTGPTGSGKSTTLAAMINHINTTKPDHIITIEDPIEYVHPHKMSLINQRELGTDTLSFENALKAVLREDPDVILVGEMRDPETIHLAITAAETGHLVFATLHTNNAAESIDRIVDVFEPAQQSQISAQLSNNIQAVIAQQLIPRVGGQGRVPALEVMIATPGIRNMIRENKTFQITSTIQTSAQIGMISMDQSLRDLVGKGVISPEVAFSKCINPEELRKMISSFSPR